MSTVRVTPPKKGVNKPRSGQGRGKTGPQEVQSWLFRYRDQLWPFWAMAVVFLVALIVADWRWLAAGYAVAAALVFFLGEHVRLDRQIERVYAAFCLVAAGGWSCWAITSAPGAVRPWLALPFMTCLVAIPWWRHRSVKKTIPVTFAPELKGQAKHRAQGRANFLLQNWTDVTRQGKIQFAELDGLKFDRWIMDVEIVLRGGQAARALSYPSVRGALESAFDAPEGSLRIMGRSKRAREITLRFVLVDPNEGSLGAPPEDVTTMGRFETGGDVEFDDRPHTVVAGATGGGKSGLMNQIIRRKARDPLWATVGVDLKPGALEFGPWEPVLAYLADKPDKVLPCLQGLLDGLTRRGEIMKERGWREWQATPAEPNICLAIDEVQLLRRIRGAMAILEDLAALSRAYGFQLILATQYPKDSNLPSAIMAQVKQIFCCKLGAPKEDRVVFGENATAEGWTPSAIPDGMPGVYYVRSAAYTAPQRARGWFMTVDEVVREARSQEATLGRTGIDPATGAAWLETGHTASRTAVEAPEGRPEYTDPGEDVVEAVVVSEDARETLANAIRAGHGTPEEMEAATGLARRTIGEFLREFQDKGWIIHEGRRATKRQPWIWIRD